MKLSKVCLIIGFGIFQTALYYVMFDFNLLQSMLITGLIFLKEQNLPVPSPWGVIGGRGNILIYMFNLQDSYYVRGSSCQIFQLGSTSPMPPAVSCLL